MFGNGCDSKKIWEPLPEIISFWQSLEGAIGWGLGLLKFDILAPSHLKREYNLLISLINKKIEFLCSHLNLKFLLAPQGFQIYSLNEHWNMP